MCIARSLTPGKQKSHDVNPGHLAPKSMIYTIMTWNSNWHWNDDFVSTQSC